MFEKTKVPQDETSEFPTNCQTQLPTNSASHHPGEGLAGIQSRSVSTGSKWLLDGHDRQYSDIALWLWTELDLLLLEDRIQIILFTRPDGTLGSYIFAFLAHLRKGQRLAILVTDEYLSKIKYLAEDIRTIKSQLTQDHADDILLYTERGLTYADCFSVIPCSVGVSNLQAPAAAIAAYRAVEGA